LKTPYKIHCVLAAALLLVAIGAQVMFWAYGQIEHAAERRKHTHEIIIHAQDWLSELKDAETGQRGYALTGDETFLEPYLKVRDGLDDSLKQLRQRTLIPEAHAHLDALAPLLGAKLLHMSQVIELRREEETVPMLALVGEGEGKRLMNSIRVEMKAFNQMEEAALAKNEIQFHAKLRLLFAILVIASLLTLVVALLFAWLIYRDTRHQLKNLVYLETLHLLGIQQETSRELEQANATLQVSEEKLAVTLNSIGDAVIATDAAGRVTLLNPLAEQLTGWTQAQAINRPVDEVFHIINKGTRLPATPPVKETLAQSTSVGRPKDAVLIARDGSECDIADSCAPIRDREGRVIGAVLVFRNVTERRQVEDALQTSEATLGGIVASVMDAVIAIDSKHRITLFNASAEEMFGRTSHEMLGANLDRLIPSQFRSAHGSQVRKFGKTNVSKRVMSKPGEVSGLHADGSEFPIDASIAQFQVKGQKMFTVVLRNITERKRADQVLLEKTDELEKAKTIAEKANLAKSDFLSSMSHELRSPLNAILGFAQLMESDSPPPTPAQKESIDQILHAGWFLLDLINEILDLAAVESGRLSLSLEQISLPEVLTECQEMIEPQAQKRSIEMTFPAFTAPCFIKADRTRLKQVLINLLSNAIKYNRDGGSVIVECAETPTGHIRINVKDTGAGLSPEMLAQLFQAFNRLGKEATAEEGTGIGLVVSKRLVELMQGKIGAASTVGEGSVFWIELIHDTDAHSKYLTATTTKLATLPTPKAMPQSVVLYVEDNHANLQLVEQLLGRCPESKLLTANNGKDGIALAIDSVPDVILMDINLPGISGIETMRILHLNPITANIPIIALSANAMPRDIEKGLAAGFHKYITKPINVTEFMNTLNLTLEFAAKRN
jgi:PAS domain S-box-containing protein